MKYMELAALPTEVQQLLGQLHAVPRLIVHLQLVYDVSIKLSKLLDEKIPTLRYDHEAVLFGAATHDIGKAVCPSELTAHGNLHEERGREILKEAGFPDRLARFAFTHGGSKREPNPTIEDLLVRTADAIWKGGRYQNSEMDLVTRIAGMTDLPEWQVYSIVDEILTELAEDADKRLRWQFLHPT